MKDMMADDGEETETEPHEAITPDNSLDVITGLMTPPRRNHQEVRQEKETPSKPEDFAAAITLLGFKVQS